MLPKIKSFFATNAWYGWWTLGSVGAVRLVSAKHQCYVRNCANLLPIIHNLRTNVENFRGENIMEPGWKCHYILSKLLRNCAILIISSTVGLWWFSITAVLWSVEFSSTSFGCILEWYDTLFFIRTILKEYWCSKSPKFENKLRTIPASELIAQGQI